MNYVVKCNPQFQPFPVFPHDVKERYDIARRFIIRIPQEQYFDPGMTSEVIPQFQQSISPFSYPDETQSQRVIDSLSLVIAIAELLTSLSLALVDIFSGRPKMQATDEAANRRFRNSNSPVIRNLAEAAFNGYKHGIPLSVSDKTIWRQTFGKYYDEAYRELQREFPTWNAIHLNHYLRMLLGEMTNGGNAYIADLEKYEQQHGYTQKVFGEHVKKVFGEHVKKERRYARRT